MPAVAADRAEPLGGQPVADGGALVQQAAWGRGAGGRAWRRPPSGIGLVMAASYPLR